MFARLIAARKDEEGFTLIELLVVIIIIGILAAIAIPVFLNQRQSAAKASLVSDARNAAVAVETAYTETGSYPAAMPATAKFSPNNAGVYSNNTTTFTVCVNATAGPAAGNKVTYDSGAGGVGTVTAGTCA